jgi:hypothetical protein
MVTEVIETRTQKEYNLHLQQEFLRKMYELCQPNTEFQASYFAMAKVTEIPANVVGTVIQLLEKNGALKRRYEWVGGNGKEHGGKKAFWTLTQPYSVADVMLKEYQQKRVEQIRTIRLNSIENARKSKTNGKTDDTVAQAKAWSERTKKYMMGSTIIRQNLDALKAAGIEVDEEAYLNSINVKQDETLAAIALVIPYIEYLEGNK